MRKSAANSEVGRMRNQWGKGSVPGLGRYCTSCPRSVHLPDGQSLVCQVAIYEGSAPIGTSTPDEACPPFGYFALQRSSFKVEPGALEMGVLQDHGVAPRGHGTTFSPAAPRLVDHYVRRAYCPRHTSTHGFLEEWPPGRRRGPPDPIICTCYSEANCGILTNNNKYEAPPIG
jgi:hypothetical protein